MIDISQLDPTFVGALWAVVTHLLAKYTQDMHGKTRPFVVVMCVVFGFLIAGMYTIFGYETVWSVIWKFLEVSGVALGGASAIWVFLHKPADLKKKLK